MKRLALAFLLMLAIAQAIAAQKPAASPTPSAARRPPQAKTQDEYKDYNAAYALSGGAKVEAAADEFATKYPDSELRSLLYGKAMQDYQQESNPSKMLAMGEKILKLDPDNSIALVLTATILSDSLSDSDQDRTQKIAEITKNANHALETVDTSFVPPANATPEQVEAHKNTLRSMAHSALGITNLRNGDDAAAEKELKAAAELNKTHPDPFIWYHLALAQDHQKKYSEALVSVEQALRNIGGSSDENLGKLATGERERLRQLTGNVSPSNPAPVPETQPSPRPPL